MVSETHEPLSLITWAFASRPLPGQSESGDHYVVRRIPNGVLMAVIDGLGHGPEAAAIARSAGQVFEENASEAPTLLLNRCHKRLLGTRGAAISLAVFNGQDNTLTWLGVGNVEGTLFRRDEKTTPSRVSLLVRAGVVGYQLPALQASVVSIAQG